MGDPRSRSAEDETLRARAAFAQGDLAAALHHTGCALTHDPMDPERTALLAQIVASAPDPLALVPVRAEESFVDAANRAYVLAWLRRWPEALDLVTDVAEVRPDIPYMLWCEWWMTQPGVMQAMPLPEIVRGIVADVVKIAGSCPVPTSKDDPRWTTIDASSRILAAYRALHPNEPALWACAAMVARRLGERAEALACAQRAYQLEPGKRNAIAIAAALRDDGRVDEAVQWYRRALGHDRNDVTAHLDLGDMFLDAGRLDEATREYESAIMKEEDQPWAAASLHYLRWQRTRDPQARVALYRLAEEADTGPRARALLDRLDPPRPFVNRLPDPADASAHAMASIFARVAENPMAHHGAIVRLAVSHVESPSVMVALHLQLALWGPQVGLDYEVEHVQAPDPREPKAQVPFIVWRWDGTQPQRVGGRPPEAVGRAIAAIAAEPFVLDDWTARAEAAARELGGAAAIPHLLGVMVHPPRPPASARVVPWVQRVQIAAALVLAHVDAHEPWATSARHQALYALLYGPTDWTTGAAIIALGVIARADAAAREEVVQAFTWLLSQRPAEGFCCWELPLVETWRSLPDLDPATAARLEALSRRIVAGETGVSTVHLCRLDPPGAAGGSASYPVLSASYQIVDPAYAAFVDPDPLVFPELPVARLSDYVGLMKAMQQGNMMGALGRYGLDMSAYAAVTTAWGQRLGGDPVLHGKYAELMAR